MVSAVPPDRTTIRAPNQLRAMVQLLITSVITGNRLRFTTSEPYAAIHNEGGTITVTKQMNAFFWAKFKDTGQPHWKRLALVKVGSKLTIPKRQFIGTSPEVERAIEQVIDDNVRDYLSNLNFK